MGPKNPVSFSTTSKLLRLLAKSSKWAPHSQDLFLTSDFCNLNQNDICRMVRQDMVPNSCLNSSSVVVFELKNEISGTWGNFWYNHRWIIWFSSLHIYTHDILYIWDTGSLENKIVFISILNSTFSERNSSDGKNVIENF